MVKFKTKDEEGVVDEVFIKILKYCSGINE
jgi:hypothetical protein